MKELHNSRTNNRIDIKGGPLSKFGKRDRLTLRKFGDDPIVTSSILGRSGAISMPESRRMVRDLNLSMNNYLLPKKS